jgi:hypothetical protein
MSQDQLKHIPKNHESNHLLRAGMYVVAVAAGIATASFKVWDRFYSKIKHTDLIKNKSADRYSDLNKVYNEANQNGMTYKRYAEEVARIEKKYSAEVNTILKEKLGVETKNVFKGTIQRYKTLGPYTKGNILFTGLVTTGTTIGAYFLLNQNARLKHQLHEVHARLDGNDSQNR